MIGLLILCLSSPGLGEDVPLDADMRLLAEAGPGSILGRTFESHSLTVEYAMSSATARERCKTSVNRARVILLWEEKHFVCWADPEAVPGLLAALPGDAGILLVLPPGQEKPPKAARRDPTARELQRQGILVRAERAKALQKMLKNGGNIVVIERLLIGQLGSPTHRNYLSNVHGQSYSLKFGNSFGQTRHLQFNQTGTGAWRLDSHAWEQ